MIGLHAKGYSYRKIAQLYNLSRQRVHQLISGYAILNGSEWWEKRKDLILRRDDFTCQKCGSKESLVTHHIDGNDRHNTIANLITLCSSCHSMLHHPPTPETRARREKLLADKETRRLEVEKIFDELGMKRIKR